MTFITSTIIARSRVIETCHDIPNVATNVRLFLLENAQPASRRNAFSEFFDGELSTLDRVLRKAANLQLTVECVASAIESIDMVVIANRLREWNV